MMVTFVSQCEKKSLTKTRRVLDAFANRIGDNTWQTIITNEGLGAVKKLLRKTASKNTAVSCHWIRSRSRSELVWIVGNRKKFNPQGQTPTNRTKRNLLQSHIENDWKYLPLIKALTALSALFHDWGKASELFQEKLAPHSKHKYKGDPIRHEWVSVLLLTSFIRQFSHTNDDDWLSALIEIGIDETKLKASTALNIERPLEGLPNAAKLIAWLIVSHHRLPLNAKKIDDSRGHQTFDVETMLKKITQEWGYENRFEEQEYIDRARDCFKFSKGLLSESSDWLKQVKKWCMRLKDCLPLMDTIMADGSFRVIIHHSRLCLMLGDHFYSSQGASATWASNIKLFANTDSSNNYKQKLDEHLVGVASNALKTAHLLPAFENEPPRVEDISALKKLSPKSPIDYSWQDKSVAVITQWKAQQTQAKYGFFAVNLASTGCGKTFANAKVMRALSEDGKGLRFILALGLRALTLQTGDEYRNRIGLDNSELAVLIGSRAVAELHQQAKVTLEKNSSQSTGSQSLETLLDESIDFDCAIPESGLTTILTCDRDKQFLYAPVLACTIDHLMASTETKRGGRYILPSLRLMSSDLVIDEIDDFTGNDLIAIGRLIHLAGMLGRKVMISSATIPPDMAEGYFKAYRDGWGLYCKTRDATPQIGCAWIDEFNTHVSSNVDQDLKSSILLYRSKHSDFIARRVAKLEKTPAKRKADIVSCQSILDAHTENCNDNTVKDSQQHSYFNLIASSALTKHYHHFCIDKVSALKVSFGVVRMANISPCVDLTRHLLTHQWPVDTQVRVMAYHSQQILLMRHQQELHLDGVLKRKENPGEQPKAFANSVIRYHLDHITRTQKAVKNVLFILVATPVEEVGRDHCFDWAVVEPSSYRSIIQLAGRVRRHRAGAIDQPNISLMQYNLKGIHAHHQGKERVFKRPGFEEKYILDHHNIDALMDEAAIKLKLDAVPRIQKPESLDHQGQLAHLEHKVTHDLLATYQKTQVGPSTLQGYLRENWFLTALPQHLTPFRQGEPSLKIFLVYDDNKHRFRFCEKDEHGYTVDREKALHITHVTLSSDAQKNLWLTRDYETAIEDWAQTQEWTTRAASLRYGELNFPHKDNKQYQYNDQLGLVTSR